MLWELLEDLDGYREGKVRMYGGGDWKRTVGSR